MVHQPIALDDFQEQVHFIDDPASGTRGVIVIHSTALGPAAGGCRLWRYPSEGAIMADAVRLARGMTYKNALAGLPLGGGKAVLQCPSGDFDRRALFHALGDAVATLDGRYVTAEDVGTTVKDMLHVAERTRHVAGLSPRADGPGGDPSPWTALGVYDSMVATVKAELGADLKGLRVAVQGTGHVGAALCSLLAKAGAHLIVADADLARARSVADRFGGALADPALILETDADIVAPCALGGVLNDHSIPTIKAKLICGAANNQLAHAGCAESLAQHGIIYAPDFVVNAGGIINVCAEYLGETTMDVRRRIAEIPGRIVQILSRARDEGRTTHQVAEAMAQSVVAKAWTQAA